MFKVLPNMENDPFGHLCVVCAFDFISYVNKSYSLLQPASVPVNGTTMLNCCCE